ncbi:MAG TPA: hypothetical protein VGH27_27765 [Streptosporangiaceae bacterium]|jgi:hypothetical protein
MTLVPWAGPPTPPATVEIYPAGNCGRAGGAATPCGAGTPYRADALGRTGAPCGTAA